MQKTLLTDPNLPVIKIALASGFGSVRRFNDVFKKHYKLSPTALRNRLSEAKRQASNMTLVLRYRPPYLWDQVLEFRGDRGGVTPPLTSGTHYREGVIMYYSTTYMSPVGLLTLACEGDNLVGLWMEGQKYFGDTIPEEMVDNPDMPVFTKTRNWLDRYFAGKMPEIAELSLAPLGGDFRQAVWKNLCEIPYGKVITYGDIAKRIAKKMNRSCSITRFGPIFHFGGAGRGRLFQPIWMNIGEKD